MQLRIVVRLHHMVETERSTFLMGTLKTSVLLANKFTKPAKYATQRNGSPASFAAPWMQCSRAVSRPLAQNCAGQFSTMATMRMSPRRKDASRNCEFGGGTLVREDHTIALSAVT